MNSLTVEENLKILNSYNCSQTKNIESESERERLRQAILFIVNSSEWQNLGICADNSEEGFRALLNYLQAFGYRYSLERDAIAPRARLAIETKNNPIYIKFNSQRMSHYGDDYIGEYRGVLISCQSEDDRLSGTYGHFPLDLFDR
jgi:hypothetical protein